MQNSIKWFSSLLIVMLLTCCEKFTKVDGPVDLVGNDDVFRNDTLATAAVTGIYSKIMVVTATFMNGGITVATGLTSDELVYNSTGTSSLEFYNNSISTSNAFIKTNLWLNAYNLLYQTNACIGGLIDSKTLRAETKQQLLGECYVLRAMMYYHLINLFGKVPLILGTDYEKNAVEPRASHASIVAQIKTDLSTAAGLLNPAYPTPEKVRINRWAATALFARVCLYTGNWEEAENAAGTVIQQGGYTLESKLDKVFVKDSRETIFQIMPVFYGFSSTEGNVFVPGSSATALPTYSISNYQMNAFEMGDKRVVEWVGSKSVNGKLYTFPYKYRLRSNFVNPVISEYYVVFRLAEQYLIRAEARANQMSLQGAIEDLDTIRSRAGLPMIDPAISKEDLLNVIYRERQTELFAEWGMRWYDLKRLKLSDLVLRSRKSAWEATDTLFPIPSSEIELNRNLSQNDGYK
jgi:starch-binding outer membrane protein, SusD/RagB family